MKRIILNGACGKMCRVVADCIAQRDGCEIVAGVDTVGEQYADFPLFRSFDEPLPDADVIIDFSHPSALEGMLRYSRARQLPIVIATTGMDERHIAMINEAAAGIAVFFTYNMSLGINLLADLARRAAAVLSDDFDIEIVEAHHNQKLDAPSGTAIMLAEAVTSGCNNAYHYEYDRHSKRAKRDPSEIGIHSIRGGTIVGEHEIIFAGRDEILKLSHSARSREILATGSINAAQFMCGRAPGIYNMSDLIQAK